MKRIVAILLLLAMLLCLTACGEKEPIQYSNHFVHQTPVEMKEHKKVLLEKEDFSAYAEDILNIRAYPDLLILDENDAESVGMYIYDPVTGMASGWVDLNTGEKILYEAGQEKNLGLPDPEKMVFFKGTVKMGAVVYEQDSVVTDAELYFFLSDPADKDLLQEYLTNYHGETLTQESETRYKIVKDAAAVAADFTAAEVAGATYDKKNADDYASFLKVNYGVAVTTEE